MPTLAEPRGQSNPRAQTRDSTGLEAWQEPLPGVRPENADGQTELPGAGAASAPEAAETADNGGSSELEHLLDGLQTRLGYDDPEPHVPAIKRKAAEFAPATWHERSSRREDEEFRHPLPLDHVRDMSDPELSARLGWLTKHKSRGLSPLDTAVLREWAARAISLRDLYGRDRRPLASDFLCEELRALGLRSTVAATIVGTLELALNRGRNGFKLSAPEARTLWGCSASTWWYAIKRLELLGVLQRVGTVKENAEGASPVQTDSNCYVPGPWLLERLEAILGLFKGVAIEAELRQAAGDAHRRLLNARKSRSRANRAASRDRNRRRHRSLGPRQFSTSQVRRVADGIEARREQLRSQVEQLAALRRAREVLDDAEKRVGVNRPPPRNDAVVASEEACLELEQAAARHVERVNAGAVDSELELPSEIRLALRQAGEIKQTEGKAGEQSTASATPPPPPDPHPSPPETTLAAPPPDPPKQRPCPTSPAPRPIPRDEQFASEGEAPRGPPGRPKLPDRPRQRGAPATETLSIDDVVARCADGSFDPALWREVFPPTATGRLR